MLAIKMMDSIEKLDQLKQQYFNESCGPLDGMWHFGFVNMSSHFGFYYNDKLVGYCCIDSQGYLLQYYVIPDARNHTKELFRLILEFKSKQIGRIMGAYVSTAESAFLSVCLETMSEFEVIAIMYKLPDFHGQSGSLKLQLAENNQLQEFVEFASKNVEMDPVTLENHYINLIKRQELFGYWHDNLLIACGECRLFDQFQTGYSDLGVIVDSTRRNGGIASQVLMSLIGLSKDQGLVAICSTQVNNVAAQKAIEKAGMVSAHRIIQFNVSTVEMGQVHDQMD